MPRRPQRAVCDVCGRSVAVLDDGTLVSHLRRVGVAGRCAGGAQPPTDGLIRPVAEEVSAPARPPADETTESVRTVRGGLPGQRRRY